MVPIKLSGSHSPSVPVPPPCIPTTVVIPTPCIPTTVIPTLLGQMDAVHYIAVGSLPVADSGVPAANLPPQRLVHRVLRSGHIPSQPLPSIPYS